jgi:hypothetical protein
MRGFLNCMRGTICENNYVECEDRTESACQMPHRGLREMAVNEIDVRAKD